MNVFQNCNRYVLLSFYASIEVTLLVSFFIFSVSCLPIHLILDCRAHGFGMCTLLYDFYTKTFLNKLRHF